MDINKICQYYQQGIYPMYNKLIVIGDIHGDFNVFINILIKNKLINREHNWIGKDTHVIQLGDILDRKNREGDLHDDEDSEFTIISLIFKLQIQSYISGGGFHMIIGNHELMNIMGIYDYVSPLGIKHFGSVKNRREFFKIGKEFCQYIACSWNVVIKIGTLLFCHGGISLNIASKYNINQINSIMRDYLYGNGAHDKQRYFDELFLNKDSILWNRTHSSINSMPQTPHKLYSAILQKNKNEILNILHNYGASSLIVGHTPQNKISSFYNGLVWCVDVGLSRAFYNKTKHNNYNYNYNSNNQSLEITNIYNQHNQYNQYNQANFTFKINK